MSRWKRSRHSLVLSAAILGVIGLFPLAGAVAGQTAPAGIIGVVTDNTGAVLPGVTVTATSPALQVPSVTTVTDESGGYRLTPLPIGTYTVAFELAGFQTVQREGVRLTVGFTARVDSEMGVGAVTETVTVSGASPLVDTTSTRTSTELTYEQVEVLPTSRDGFHAFMNQAPGVRTNLDVGSSGLGDTLSFRAFGETGGSWQMLEGVMSAAPNPAGANGSHVDFNAIEGARVETMGSNAEMPRSGILVDAVMKSGGNDFHGNAVVYGSGPGLEGDNISDTLKSAGFRRAKLKEVRDFSGTLGGRIVRNKLWFFTGARYQESSREILDAVDPDGTPIAGKREGPYYFGKVSYQMTSANRFTGFMHVANDKELRGANKFTPRESMLDKDGPITTSKADWQTTIGNSFVASVQYGRWDFESNINGVSKGKIPTIDIATLYVTGDLFARNGLRRDMGRHHTKGFLTYYKPNFALGSHEFKVGVDHLWTWITDGSLGREEGFPDYQLRFNNGAAFQIDTVNVPQRGENYANFIGVYGQDRWTLTRKLTFNLGLRLDHDEAWAPRQCREAATFAAAQCWDEIRLVTFNALAPRAHVAFDIMGDGKTVLKGGYGRFNYLRELDPDVVSINQNTRATTRWDWHDNNGNKQYDPGEVNLDPLGPDFRSISGTRFGLVNPNEKQPKTDEFSMTFERELLANTAVRVTGMYSRNTNVFRLSEPNRDGRYTIPVTNLDPGPDGRLGTSDDTGKSITYYEYPASLGSAAFAQTMIVNDADAQTFKTFEVMAIKRSSDNWQLNASYTTTWFDVPVTCGDAGTGSGTNRWRCYTNPNIGINSADKTREWQAKLSGAYTFPYGILASTNYDIRSGPAQARQVLLAGGATIRSLLLNVEEIGSLRLPNTHEMDIRLAKRVNLGTARWVELRADIYNVLNKSTTMPSADTEAITGWVLQSGADFRRPLNIMYPRIIQFGATMTF
jgi:hypothetical protein